MPGTRSRRGCTECRQRRRKCDEAQPTCGLCSTFRRPCKYTLRVIWDTGLKQPSKKTPGGEQRAQRPEPEPQGAPEDGVSLSMAVALPRTLPNGVPLSSRYHRLLSYFTNDILASLSVHPSVHEDLRRDLIPATLRSPQLLSACLALSAAGFLSRGMSEVDGMETSRILQHLQSSGLSLLRQALQARQTDETVLATCLIWCLADVFAYRQGSSSSSWQTHLQGIRAILADGDQAGTVHRYFAVGSAASQAGMRHLYLLYLSLQTLPHVPTVQVMMESSHGPFPADDNTSHSETLPQSQLRAAEQAFDVKIDGFLGYSEELLHILQRVNELARDESEGSHPEADILLGRLNAMIARDAQAAPDVEGIISPLSAEHNREFALCHRTFQQATLIHVYRRLYHLPSNSSDVQAAVLNIADMLGGMTQGQPCRTWVAMAMPLFALGCEAFCEEQQAFVRERVHQLEKSIGSHHVRAIRQALEDVWRMRREAGDLRGDLCANQFLDMLQYNIILF